MRALSVGGRLRIASQSGERDAAGRLYVEDPAGVWSLVGEAAQPVVIRASHSDTPWHNAVVLGPHPDTPWHHGRAIGGRGDYWRQQVHRMAHIFLEARRQTADDFAWDRHCRDCGATFGADRRVVLENEWAVCPACTPTHERLYDPSVARDGYWYATCLVGKDPNAPARDAERGIEAHRLGELRFDCEAVGLVFGSVRPAVPARQTPPPLTHTSAAEHLHWTIEHDIPIRAEGPTWDARPVGYVAFRTAAGALIVAFKDGDHLDHLGGMTHPDGRHGEPGDWVSDGRVNDPLRHLSAAELRSLHRRLKAARSTALSIGPDTGAPADNVLRISAPAVMIPYVAGAGFGQFEVRLEPGGSEVVHFPNGSTLRVIRDREPA